MLVGDFLHHGQAQARALGLGRDVRLERALQDMLGKAGAVVLHSGAPPRPRLVAIASALDATCAAAPRRSVRVLRVLQQVVDHLAQLRARRP